jgi:hypothetical protein
VLPFCFFWIINSFGLGGKGDVWVDAWLIIVVLLCNLLLNSGPGWGWWCGRLWIEKTTYCIYFPTYGGVRLHSSIWHIQLDVWWSQRNQSDFFPLLNGKANLFLIDHESKIWRRSACQIHSVPAALKLNADNYLPISTGSTFTVAWKMRSLRCWLYSIMSKMRERLLARGSPGPGSVVTTDEQ